MCFSSERWKEKNETYIIPSTIGFPWPSFAMMRTMAFTGQESPNNKGRDEHDGWGRWWRGQASCKPVCTYTIWVMVSVGPCGTCLAGMLRGWGQPWLPCASSASLIQPTSSSTPPLGSLIRIWYFICPKANFCFPPPKNVHLSIFPISVNSTSVLPVALVKFFGIIHISFSRPAHI